MGIAMKAVNQPESETENGRENVEADFTDSRTKCDFWFSGAQSG
jgi:hypothetical protein